MVKLIVIARCIPEDVYLRSLESPVHLQLAGEKKFPVVVREPEEWPIGRLANEIKTRYESLYKRQFGQVKYLKDNDDDCDLDPDLTVADLLVDEGKAARDGSDQKKVIKLIQEQGRAIRQGSVIPDLTPVHYQPRTLPPIPRFPGTEWRRTEDRQLDERPTKRRRLGEIEEETNVIVNSIERDALNGNLRHVDPVIEPKIESPELASTWINTGPATIDELELLPEAPAHFRPRSRRGYGDSRRRQEPGPEIRESSIIPHEDRQQAQQQQQQQQQLSAEVSGHRHSQASELVVRHSSHSHSHAPTTPSNLGINTRTPGGQVVTMLNSMKSHSPVIRQSPSKSASRFRKPARNVYDYPESDIDDTQMSPRSRASRTRITPKLVQTPHSKGKPGTDTRTSQSNLQQASIIQESPTLRRTNGHDGMAVNHDQEHQLPHPPSHGQVPPVTKLTVKSLERADRERNDEAIVNQRRQSRESFNRDRSSILGSDETWSIHEDGTRRKKSRLSRNQRRSGGDVSTSRSSSLASSTRDTSNTERSGSRKLKRKRVVPTRVNDGQSRSEFSELDSPGLQLSETLRRSSLVSRPSKETSQNVSESTTRSSHALNRQRRVEESEDAEMEDVERSPESVSESEEETPLAKAPKRPKTGKSSQSSATNELRCYTCWSKQNRCDNQQPKCSSCTKNKKNCQILDITKTEFEKEKAKRQAEKESKAQPSRKSRSKKTQAKNHAQDKTLGQADPDDKIDDEVEDEHSFHLDSKGTNKSQTQSESFTSKAEEDHSELEEQVSTSSGDESTHLNNKSVAPKASQGRIRKSMNRQQSASETSGRSNSAVDLDTDAKTQKKRDDTKETSTSTEDLETQVREVVKTSNSKGKALTSGKRTSPVVQRNQVLNAKSSDLSNSVHVAASVETVRQSLPATPKDALSVPTEKSITRGRSIETRVTSTGKVLPPGMTEEEYESLVGSRANLTDQQRLNQKMRNKKLDKRTESTPSLVHQPSTQETTEKTKQNTPSVRSTQQGSSSQPNSKPQSKPPPSTQPAHAPASVKTSTPMSAPAKVKAELQTTDSSSKTKLKLQPTSANKGVKIKSPNPLFRPHQPQPKPVTANSLISTSTTPTSLNASRSLKDIRAVLTSQSRSGSGASTPQPVRATAAKIAEMRRGVSSVAASARKNITSLSDDDDDDDDSDDDEDEDEDEKDSRIAIGSTVKKSVGGNAVVTPRLPSDSGSGSGSATSDAEENDSGSGSGSDSSDDDDDDDDDEATGSEDDEED